MAKHGDAGAKDLQKNKWKILRGISKKKGEVTANSMAKMRVLNYIK